MFVFSLFYSAGFNICENGTLIMLSTTDALHNLVACAENS